MHPLRRWTEHPGPAALVLGGTAVGVLAALPPAEVCPPQRLLPDLAT